MKRSEIAKEVKVHRSTITRELKRNADESRGYHPSSATKMTRERHQNKRKRCIDEEIWSKVEECVRQQWSPEQISARLKMEGVGSISHETIYLRIYRDKREGGDLYKHMRRRQKYRKRNGKYYGRKGWDTRRPISERPEIVETRSRIGDWEADTIIGSERIGGIISLVERRSRYCLLQKVPTKSAQTVAEAICTSLSPVKDKVLTITSDNGIEFMRHESIAKTLDADFYFADPYSSWQRGTNENTNGLVRQYFPKRTNFANIPAEAIRDVADRLNNRPRKALNFRTPNEVFNNHFVALIT
jgi:IS30 family transposase